MHKNQKKPERELLFSVTADDCKWEYYRASGKGGQHRNKTDSACRCTHIASGAVGQSADERSQWQNKKLAFVRMANSDKFKKWHKIETARRLRDKDEIEREERRLEKFIEDAMKPENILTQIEIDGKWVTVTEEELNDKE